MKKLISIFIFAVLIAANCYSQNVYYVCNPSTVNAKLGQTKVIPLNETCGHVIVPGDKYKHSSDSSGLLIFHHLCADEYFAFDVCCPKCKSKGQRSNIIMETSILAVCKKCKTQWQNLCLGTWTDTNADGEYPLTCYYVYEKGNNIIVTDKFQNQ